MKPIKLNEDERDLVAELVSGQGWPLLLDIIGSLVENKGSQLLRYNGREGEGVSELARLHQQYKGADSLLTEIRNLKTSLKLKM